MLKSSEPIVITTDNTVIEKLKINNPGGFSVIVKADNVTIKECDLCGGINLCGKIKNVKIINNYIHDIKPEYDMLSASQVAGVRTTEAKGEFREQELGADGILIKGNYFENVPSGIYIVGSCGNIEIDGNYSKNQYGPFPRGQICQLYACKTSKDTFIRIENNFSFVDSKLPSQRSFMTNGRIGAEDHINCYKCSGCKESPIVIRNNYIYGGSGSSSNSGIMAGDGGGEYFHVLDNKVYYSENCGIGVCGGTGNIVKGNKIFQDKCLAWEKREEGRGLQIECYGSPFYGENIIEENIVAFKTTLRSYAMCNLLCRTDTAVFRNNKFCTAEEFGEWDKFPEHEPMSAEPSMIKPWRLKEETKYEVI